MMHLTKKSFFTLIAINSLLPLFLILMKGVNKESWVILIICAIVALASLFLFVKTNAGNKIIIPQSSLLPL
jgi:hypothetical protein